MESADKANKNLQEQLQRQAKTLDEMRLTNEKQQKDFSRSLNDLQKANVRLTENIKEISAQKQAADKKCIETLEKLKELKEKGKKPDYHMAALGFLTATFIAAAIHFLF